MAAPVRLISVLLWLTLAESAIVHHSYHRPDVLDQSDPHLKNPPGSPYGKLPLDLVQAPPLPTSSPRFQPTGQSCCLVGKRVAKKKMVCNINVLVLFRNHNYEWDTQSNQYSYQPAKPKGGANKLSDRIAKCSKVHPKYFTKCCTRQEEFYKHMKNCQLRPRRLRKKCKQLVKKKLS